MEQNSDPPARQQEIAYSDAEWESIRLWLKQLLHWDANLEMIPSNEKDVKSKTFVPAPLRTILEKAARMHQHFIEFSAALKEDRSTAHRVINSMYDNIDRAHTNCEDILNAGVPGIDMNRLEIARQALEEIATYCRQDLKVLQYRAEGNQNSSRGVNDYLSWISDIWDRIDADPKVKRRWRHRFMLRVAAPFLGSDTSVMVESWSRQQRLMRAQFPKGG